MNILQNQCRARKAIHILLMSSMLVIGGFIFPRVSSADDSLGVSYAAISFTPDSKKLVFNRCQHQHHRNCSIHVLDLKTKGLTYFQAPENQEWYAAKFSPSGERIVFVSVPLTPGYLPGEDKNKVYPDFGNAQIAMMNADGRNVHLLTNKTSYKMAPNFSWSGKKVLFVQGEMRKPSSKTLAAGLDAYEIDLESGNIRQLTDFKFFQMGRPSYLPGDAQFVVDIFGPTKIPGIAAGDNPTYWRGMNRKHNNSQFYVFGTGSATQVLEPMFDQLKGARSPLVDAQGNLYFDASNGRTLRRYRLTKSGELNDYLWLPNTGRFGFGGEVLQSRFTEVAPDGSQLAVVTGSKNPRDYSGIFLLNFATGLWEEVHVPAKADLANP